MPNFLPNVPLKNYTTTKIGGPAKFFLEVKARVELTEAISQAQRENLPYLVIGEGSNLLVSDKGTGQLIIKNNLQGINLHDQTIEVQSGTPLQDLVDFTIQHGFSGLQKLTGIPGTVGGAIYGNAGAYGQGVSDFLTEVVCWDGKKIVTLSKTDCHFTYRDSDFKRNGLAVLTVKFQLPPADPQLLSQEAWGILAQRTAKYPLGIRCPGSFFKNVLAENVSSETLKLIPEDKVAFGKIAAGYLLETVGAKGQRLGDIQITRDHANLFVNLGKGTAADFYTLAAQYRAKVKDRFGIELEPEVQLINLPPFS